MADRKMTTGRRKGFRMAAPVLGLAIWALTGCGGGGHDSSSRPVQAKILIAGGYDNKGGYSALADLYDAGLNTFSPTGGMAQPRIAQTGTFLGNGKVLMAGGTVQHLTDDAGISEAELYDPASGKFIPSAHPMTSARSNHIAALLPSGKVLLAGGVDGTGAPLASAELYDPTADTFLATSRPMSAARRYFQAVSLRDGRVLLAGGFDASFTALDTAEIYDPAADTFTPTGHAMTQPRTFFTMTLLQSGKVLIAGGAESFTAYTATAEVYDPATDTFTATATPMSDERAGHSATLLNSGKVLLDSGSDSAASAGLVSATADLYDPATNACTPTSHRPTAPRAGSASVLLGDGRVLIAGGSSDGTDINTSAEVYDPTLDSFAPVGSMSAQRGIVPLVVLGSGTGTAGQSRAASVSTLPRLVRRGGR